MHHHHIVPRHRDPSSEVVVECTRIQHAMFHWCEWKLHGLIADYRAWNMLRCWSHGGHTHVASGHLQSISSKAGKASSKQKWRCTITGHVSNAGGLKVWQRARGIDTTNRERIQ